MVQLLAVVYPHFILLILHVLSLSIFHIYSASLQIPSSPFFLFLSFSSC